MSAGGVFAFPTVCPDTPEGIVDTLAARAVDSDYTYSMVNGSAHDTWKFPSPERFCAYAAREFQKDANRDQCYQRETKRHKNGKVETRFVTGPEYAWSGADFPHAFHMGTVRGWPEATALVTGVYDKLTASKLSSRIPVIAYMEEPGEDVDVSAYLSGDDACFVSMARTDSAHRGGRDAVRVRHSMIVTHNVDAQEIVTRGIVTAAIVHLLETAGVRVMVEMDADTVHSGRVLHLECALKHYSEPVDLPRLTYWLAHPSALRRVQFAATSEHYVNQYPNDVDDSEDVVRVTAAQRGNDAALELAKATLRKAGFELA